MDQNASSDYYIVASARFVNQSLWQSVTGVAVLHYSNSKGKAAGSLPDPSNDVYDTSFSLNQAMSIKHAFATLSFVCEIFIFLYVGMDVLDMEKWRFVNRRYGSYVKALSSMRVLQACANLKAWELSARF